MSYKGRLAEEGLRKIKRKGLRSLARKRGEKT